jgi:hypothetical protein
MFKKLTLIGALLTACLPGAFAQSGFDYYQVPRTIVITAATKFTGSTVWSNNPVDLHGSVGIAKVDIAVYTNGAAGKLDISGYTSPDLTNWTLVGSCSVVSNTTSFNYTNSTYISAGNTNPILATNILAYPFLATTPVASSAGFATLYPFPYPFTNSFVIDGSKGGTFEFGFNAQDINRYFSLQYAGASTGTNFVAAFITIRKQQ